MREPRDSRIDPSRVERGVQLDCEPAGDGRYKVTGGDSIHWVDLVSRDHPRCDCGDYLWRDAICKHIIAARLREGDADVISEVGTLVRMLRSKTLEQSEALRKVTAA